MGKVDMSTQHNPQSEAHLDSEARASYARMVTRLFAHWQLSITDQLALLGLNEDRRSTLNRYQAGKPLANSRDLLERVVYLFDIHAQLRLIFNQNRNLAYGWMTAQIDDFGCLTPVEVVNQYGIVGLNMLSTYLNKVRGE